MSDAVIADMDCIELVERVTEYLEGTLSAEDVARFEHHVRRCPGCGEILEQFRALIAVTGALRVEDAAAVPPASREALLAAFRAWRVARVARGGPGAS
jgi:anti-sigma factor RsiW